MKLNKFFGIIGSPRTGKTTFAKQICEFSIKPVIWVTPHNEVLKKGKVLNPNLYDKKKFNQFLKTIKGHLIVWDDVMLCQNVEKDAKILYELAAYRGHLKNDIIIISHSFRSLPPKIPGLFEVLCLFKSSESDIPEDKKNPLLFQEVKIGNFKGTYFDIYMNLQKCEFDKGEKLKVFKHYFVLK